MSNSRTKKPRNSEQGAIIINGGTNYIVTHGAGPDATARIVPSNNAGARMIGLGKVLGMILKHFGINLFNS